MTSTIEILKKLEEVFDKDKATVLAEVISEAYNDLIKTSDFSELKKIVRELTEAQKRAEIKVGELAESVTTFSNDIKTLTENVKILAKRQ